LKNQNNYKNMNLLESIIERAKADKQRIVLPEGTEVRTLHAAELILSDDVADIYHGISREKWITKYK
jgi:phosphotransacetylase